MAALAFISIFILQFMFFEVNPWKVQTSYKLIDVEILIEPN